MLDLIIFSSFQNLIIFIDITIKKIKHTFPSEKVAAYWRIFLTQNLSIILCYAHEQVLITFWTSFPCWKAGMITFWTMFVAEKLAWSPFEQCSLLKSWHDHLTFEQVSLLRTQVTYTWANESYQRKTWSIEFTLN